MSSINPFVFAGLDSELQKTALKVRNHRIKVDPKKIQIANEILVHVASKLGIELTEILNGKRGFRRKTPYGRMQEITDARVIATKLIIEKTHLGETSLGLILNRDRSTIYYYRDQFDVLYQTDRNFRLKYQIVC